MIHRMALGTTALAILLMAGCSIFTSTSKSIEVTGDSIVALGTQFDAVSRHMTTMCVNKTYTVATCTNYTAFGTKFKLAYPAAKSLWNSATQFEDKGLLAGAVEALSKLQADLTPFLQMMGGK